jgi:rsbT co-antagonist protein RsbR
MVELSAATKGQSISTKDGYLSGQTQIPALIDRDEAGLLDTWTELQMKYVNRRRDLIDDSQVRASSQQFLSEFRQALQHGSMKDLASNAWNPVRAHLGDLSRQRAQQGFSPAETATYILSLKQPLFARIQEAYATDAERLAAEAWLVTTVIDELALFTIDVHQKSREAIILRQQEEMMELSTPVVSLWENILALPLIGTLDSSRTQVVMQNLLEAVVNHGAAIAIIDITGVPTVDTLVAQHLLKTVAATRLMGADCIISGIRPQIAQTIIHLGVDLTGVVTKATLADAFQLALRRLGYTISSSHARLEGA